MLDYADNPDKTMPQRYLDSDLYDTLKYAANDAKTDRTMFVGGINCSKQNAYGEMVAVQKRFGNRGSVVAYHGIQSFRAGEVTPEAAFEIGKETARRMWGDRYQVLVTVHLNTENIHCHKKELTQKIAPLRKKLRQAKKILDESPHLYELLQEEHRLEQTAYQRFRERMK